MDKTAYLKRISYDGSTECTVETLKNLVEAHLRTVPYETLHLSGGTGVIRLKLDEIYHRLVTRRIGGVCFELTVLFHWLLKKIGFEADLVMAKIYPTTPQENNHPIIKIQFVEETWFVDVGGGGAMFSQPLKDDTSRLQEIRDGIYKVLRQGNIYTIQRKRKSRINVDGSVCNRSSDESDDWKVLLEFRDDAKTLADLDPAFRLSQIDPESYIVRNCVCCRYSERGLLVLIGRTLIVKEYVDSLTERIVEKTFIEDDLKLIEIIEKRFAIALDVTPTFVSLDFVGF